MDSTFKVSEDTLKGLPVSLSRSMHKLRQFVDGKGNVWAGKGEVLKGAHKFAIRSGINRGGWIGWRQGISGTERGVNILCSFHMELIENVIYVSMLG
ncbi:hypothetical protein HanHA300_Chr01g0013711 [Helianthus annuus]|nr:hypothetical protein HanHA300_Chr01g0013711 [Helianthus annuus]KAJ0626578.1 hypothetical protein HanHA89_Chr01g0014771 [Helianthus annuus]KAJ0782921.1 hypothetical protein HanLR1_Chr01g0013721 [Helianthus annuus]